MRPIFAAKIFKLIAIALPVNSHVIATYLTVWQGNVTFL
jgi:hypothetical protein